MAAHPSDAQAKADNHADAGARPPLRYNEEKVEAIMKEFVNSTSTEYAFAPPMSPQERAIVHSMAEKYSLNHTSEGTPDKRVVVLGKTNLVAISNSASVEEKLSALVTNQTIMQGQIERLLRQAKQQQTAGAPGGHSGGNAKGPAPPSLAKDVALAHALAANEGEDFVAPTAHTPVAAAPAKLSIPIVIDSSSDKHRDHHDGRPISPRHVRQADTPAAISHQFWRVKGSSQPEKTATVPAGSAAPPPTPGGHRKFTPTPAKAEGTFRFVNWNIEWMDHFFTGPTDKPEIAASSKEDKVDDVPALCKRIGSVVTALNPDVLAVEEGPETIQRMQLFVDKFLGGSFSCFGGIDGAQQRVYILVKKDGAVKNPHIHEPSQSFLSKEWHFDVGGDFRLLPYKFARTPVVVEGEIGPGDKPTSVYFMALHTKSKFIAKGKELWTSRNPSLQMEFIKKAVKNRRRIAGECSRTRACIDRCIFAVNPEALVLVSGDLNDGPGMDFFESYYLLGDSVAMLMGSPFYQKKLLRACLLEHGDLEAKDELYSVVFNDFVERISDKKVLLDHIFISNKLDSCIVNVGIAHDVAWKYNSSSATTESGRDARVSDHVPVFGDFRI